MSNRMLKRNNEVKKDKDCCIFLFVIQVSYVLKNGQVSKDFVK